ncbi:hypothetical protein PR048_023984 [Dryococelus australis]|uniref:Uncharacterized protein n=1 Tax=Dryococelus australis TaxID=614101 RepID=A0ABQ9GVL0_9NEOP|nr:hypothetical protein PR048_023984 [Dryococelus australis]
MFKFPMIKYDDGAESLGIAFPIFTHEISPSKDASSVCFNGYCKAKRLWASTAASYLKQIASASLLGPKRICGAAVVERLDCLPLPRANCVQSPAGSRPDFMRLGIVPYDAALQDVNKLDHFKVTRYSDFWRQLPFSLDRQATHSLLLLIACTGLRWRAVHDVSVAAASIKAKPETYATIVRRLQICTCLTRDSDPERLVPYASVSSPMLIELNETVLGHWTSQTLSAVDQIKKNSSGERTQGEATLSEMGRQWNARAGETGVPRENSLASGIVQHDSTYEDPGVNPPGIEPVSPWWEASAITTVPPLSPSEKVVSQVEIRHAVAPGDPAIDGGGDALVQRGTAISTAWQNLVQLVTARKKHAYKLEYVIRDRKRRRLILDAHGLSQILRSVAAPKGVQNANEGYSGSKAMAWTMQLVGGFSRGSPVCPAISFRHCSILTSITLIGSQDLAVTNHQNLFTHSAAEFLRVQEGCNWGLFANYDILRYPVVSALTAQQRFMHVICTSHCNNKRCMRCVNVSGRQPHNSTLSVRHRWHVGSTFMEHVEQVHGTCQAREWYVSKHSWHVSRMYMTRVQHVSNPYMARVQHVHGTWETGGPRENQPTGDIVQHSHMWKSGVIPSRNEPRSHWWKARLWQLDRRGSCI